MKRTALALTLILAISSIATFFPVVIAENPSVSPDNSSNFDSQILWKTNITWELSETPARNLRENDIRFKQRTWASPVVVGDVLYAGSTSTVTLDRYGSPEIRWINVYAFNASSGSKIWEHKGNSSEHMTNLAVVDGVIYFGAGVYGDGYNALGDYVSGNYVNALNASSGKLLWRTACSTFVSSPAIVQGRVFIGSGDSLISLDATKGNIIWNFTTGDVVLSSPTVVNGVVYVGSNDANLYALNAVNGEKIWSATAGAGFACVAAVANGVVYASSSDGYVYALNAARGVKLWDYDTTPADYQWQKRIWLPQPAQPSSPYVDGGVVYFTASFLPFDQKSTTTGGTFEVAGDGWSWVYALHAANGFKIWNITIGYWGDGGSAPVIVEGIVYTRTERSIFGLSVNNGAIIWNYTNIDLIFASDPVVVNGVLYIGSGDGQVYAITAPSAPAEPFPTVPVASAAAVVLAVFGLLFYFRKRKR